MQPLDENSTRLLMRAIDIMQDEEGIDLPARDHPLLRLQRLDPIKTEQGAGYCLAIGQLSQIDPPRYKIKMILIVVDQRDRQSWEGQVFVFPVSYHDQDNDVSEVAALLSKSQVRKFNALVQQSLSNYARAWLVELHTAGYF